MSKIAIKCAYDKLVPIKDLKPHPKNPNKHTKDQISRLAKIISYQGIRRPVRCSNQSGFITAGHGLVEALKQLGQTDAPVNFQDYQDEDQEYADIVADNSIASWAELDLASINLEVPSLGPDFDIDLLGIKDFEIESADKYADKDADEVPAERKTDIKLNDLFQLGDHRLLCGDATSKENVERLMNGEKADMVYTDPPYGMNLDTDWSKEFSGVKGTGHSKMGMKGRKYSSVIGDSEDFDPSFLLDYFADVKEMFLWGGDYYCQELPKDGSWIVWDKRTRADGEAIKQIMGSEFELCWSKQKHARQIARILWAGICQGPKEGARVHPTQKPAALHEWFFERWGKDKNNIIDLYLGSGSTLIACEKTNRRCFGSEIDPSYCDVIVRRWMKFTGQMAYLIGDESGELKNGPVPFAELDSLRSATHIDANKNIAPKNVGQSEEVIVRKNAKPVAKKA